MKTLNTQTNSWLNRAIQSLKNPQSLEPILKELPNIERQGNIWGIYYSTRDETFGFTPPVSFFSPKIVFYRKGSSSEDKKLRRRNLTNKIQKLKVNGLIDNPPQEFKDKLTEFILDEINSVLWKNASQPTNWNNPDFSSLDANRSYQKVVEGHLSLDDVNPEHRTEVLLKIVAGLDKIVALKFKNDFNEFLRYGLVQEVKDVLFQAELVKEYLTKGFNKTFSMKVSNLTIFLNSLREMGDPDWERLHNLLMSEIRRLLGVYVKGLKLNQFKQSDVLTESLFNYATASGDDDFTIFVSQFALTTTEKKIHLLKDGFDSLNDYLSE